MSQRERVEDFSEIIDQLRTIADTLDEKAMSMLRDAIESGASKPTTNEKKVIQARRAIEKAVSLLE